MDWLLLSSSAISEHASRSQDKLLRVEPSSHQSRKSMFMERDRCSSKDNAGVDDVTLSSRPELIIARHVTGISSP